jgi:diguanylate cyclase (GGDEF)-like protein
MNFYSIPPLISSLLFLAIGIFVVAKNKKITGFSFFLFAFFSFWWQFSWFILFNTYNSTLAYLIVRIGYTGIVFLPVALSSLLMSFTETSVKKYNYLNYSIASIFVIFIWSTNFFVRGFYTYYFGYYPKANWLHLIYLVWLTYLLVSSQYKLYVYKKSINSPSITNQFKFTLLGSFIYTLAAGDFLVNYGVSFYPIGFVFITIGLGIYAYAIVKYRLMDIDLAWRYILTYVIYVFVGLCVFTPIVLLIHFFIENLFVQILLTISSIVIIAPSMYKYLIKKIKPIVLGKTYKYWEKLDDLINNSSKGVALKDMISKKINSIEEIMNLENITLYIYKNSKKMFCPYEKLNDEGKEQPIDTTKSIKDNNKFIELLKLSGQPILKEELLKNKSLEQMQIIKELENINSNAVFGLFLNNELVGILCLGEKKDGKVFHKEDINKVANIIYLIENDLSIEMEHKDRVIQIGDKYQHDLTNASKRIINIKDIDELSKTIMHIIIENTNAKHGIIYLLNKDAKMFIKKYEEGKNKNKTIESISETNYLIKILYDQQKPILISKLRQMAEDYQLSDIKEALKTVEQIGCQIILPIVLDGVLGFICLWEKSGGELYDNADINIFDLVAYTSAMAIQNILFAQDLIIDPLTKINNRKYCDEQIIKSINQTLRSKENLSCIMIDIDHFKDYNDKYGHQYGDTVLRKVGEYLQNMIRPNDYVCRYGGEEFIIVLPLTKLQGAKVIAERIRKGIKTKLELKEDITISLGVSILTTNISYKENNAQDIVKIKQEFIERADKALYQAKNEGRNKVCVSEEMKLEEE